MKKCLSLLLAVCLLLCSAVTVSAQDAPDTGPDDSVVITPLSGFIDGDEIFYTYVRLYVQDEDGYTVSGAVYGLYDEYGNLVEQLTTNSSGTAESSQISVDCDYYLEELTTPTGYLPNEGRYDIVLTSLCAPSRVDVYAEYEYIRGYLEVVKTDENGDPLGGCVFEVYRYESYDHVDTITTDSSGRATTGQLRYGEYMFYESQAPEGYASGETYYGYVSEQGDTAYVYIQNERESGSVRINKKGNDGRSLAGAVFSIYNKSGNWMEEITTNTNGIAISSDLVLGEYYAVEKTAPDGYIKESETVTLYPFTLTYHGQRVTLNIENQRAGEPGRVRVLKTDDSANPLAGVVFELYRAWDNKLLGQLTTGQDGTAKSDLLIPGEYYLTEKTGLPGYEVATGQFPFTLDGDGATVEVGVENPAVRIFGKVTVNKMDEDGNPLAGVRLGLYCQYDYLLEELVTGEDGTATSGILNAGSYYVREIAGLEGYLYDEQQYPFEIVEDREIVSVTIENHRITGAVKVIKTDDSGNPIPGVVFGIYPHTAEPKPGEDEEQIAGQSAMPAEAAPIMEIVTGEDGTATSDPLYYGDYELRELSAPDGYEMDSTPIPFSITEQGAVLEFNITNPFIIGRVRVNKSGPEGEPLAGALFGVYNAAGQKIAELTTGEDGGATSGGLVKGLYYLKELAAPEGYVRPDDMLPFEISGHGQVVTLELENTPGFADLRLTKTGEGGEALAGVAFDVYRVSTGEVAGTMLTDENGIAVLTLPLGNYQLRETATAHGYALMENLVSVMLTTDGSTVEIHLVNRKATEQPQGGRAAVIKTDSETGLPLAGATFGIFCEIDDEKVAEFTTGHAGTAESRTLPHGEYYLLELAAPDGYVLNEDKIYFSIEDCEVAQFEIENTPAPAEPEPEPDENGLLRIVKRGAGGGGAKLEGAVFGIYLSATGQKTGEVVTDVTGNAEVSLPQGHYYLKEPVAPAGYVAVSATIPFYVDGEGDIVHIEVSNAKGDSGLKVINKDDEGTMIPGSKFDLYDETTGEKITELVVGEDGTISRGLQPGKYYINQTYVPEGYRLNEKKHSFTVKDGEITEVVIINDRIKGTVTVHFLRVGDNKVLADKQTLTDAVGTDYIVWMRASGYDPLSIDGYTHVKTEYPSTKKLIDGDLNVVVWYEGGDSAAPGTDGGNNPYIPKTGQPFPVGTYALAAACFALALMLGVKLCRQRKKEKAG